MKKLLLGVSLALLSTICLANTPTALDAHWICTTNASSSDNQADKDADKHMSDTQKSAVSAFSYASAHCRDCTKITCEYQK